MLYPVMGSDGKAWGCVRRGSDWNSKKVFHPAGGQEPKQVAQRSGHSMDTARAPVWTTLSGTWGILGVVQCRSRSWTRCGFLPMQAFCDSAEMWAAQIPSGLFRVCLPT